MKKLYVKLGEWGKQWPYGYDLYKNQVYKCHTPDSNINTIYYRNDREDEDFRQELLGLLSNLVIVEQSDSYPYETKELFSLQEFYKEWQEKGQMSKISRKKQPISESYRHTHNNDVNCIYIGSGFIPSNFEKEVEKKEPEKLEIKCECCEEVKTLEGDMLALYKRAGLLGSGMGRGHKAIVCLDCTMGLFQ